MWCRIGLAWAGLGGFLIYLHSSKMLLVLQLGQPSVNPPRLVLEVGGTSTKQAAMPGELKSPPTWNLEGGGTSTLQAQLPARLKSAPLQAQVWGGSRWADLAVSSIHKVLPIFISTWFPNFLQHCNI